MKQFVLVLFVAAIATATAGCGRSSDLAPLAAEANGIVKSYQPRLVELEQRAKDLVRRGSALQLGPDAIPASDQLAEVIKDLLPRMQMIVREAPAKIERTVADDKLEEPKKLAELRAYSHQIESELVSGWLRANAQLDTVEAWLSHAERRPRVQAPATTPQPEPAPAQPEPAPAAKAPEGGTGAPAK